MTRRDANCNRIAWLTLSQTSVTQSLESSQLIALCLTASESTRRERAVQIAITAYVPNGETHEGSWPILKGNNIRVTTTLSVSSARATASVLIIDNP